MASEAKRHLQYHALLPRKEIPRAAQKQRCPSVQRSTAIEAQVLGWAGPEGRSAAEGGEELKSAGDRPGKHTTQTPTNTPSSVYQRPAHPPSREAGWTGSRRLDWVSIFRKTEVKLRRSPSLHFHLKTYTRACLAFTCSLFAYANALQYLG